MSNYLARLVFIVTALAAVVGCIPESKDPLSDESNSEIPAALIGNWYAVFGDAKDWTEVTFRQKPASKRTMQFGDDQQWDDFFAFGDDKQYFLTYCLAYEPEPETPTKTQSYFVFLATQTDKGFDIFPLDDGRVAELIRANKLKGKITTGSGILKNMEFVHIEEPKEGLLEYLRDPKSGVFSKKPTCRLQKTKPDFPQRAQSKQTAAGRITELFFSFSF